MGFAVRRNPQDGFFIFRAVNRIRASLVTSACGILGALALWCFSIVSASNAAPMASVPQKPEASGQIPLIECQLQPMNQRWEGLCFGLNPIVTIIGSVTVHYPHLTIARAASTKTGVWRKDVHPTGVWAGELNGFNPSVPLEIEIYAGGSGVLRSPYGWFAVSKFAVNDSKMWFEVDTSHEVPPSELDREIVQRAAAILSSDSVWNRADDRNCPSSATTWSIYCAMQRASIEITGGFHNRRPALQVLREILAERIFGDDGALWNIGHRLMDYNNQSIHLNDVQSLFADTLKRMRQE